MPPGRLYDTPRMDNDPLVTPFRPPPVASLRPPRILGPYELADKATRLFAPNLSPNRRRDRTPVHPLFALRASSLPPPAAEIDERPRQRSRRFKLFNQGVPELRICVLDPRRRWHLVRWQPFVLPSHPSVKVPTRGDARRMFPGGRHIPREPFGVLPPTVRDSATQTGPVKNGGHMPAILTPAPASASLPARPASAPPKRNRAQRQEWRRRLKQHLWILDMEYERRFRESMNRQIDAICEWQDENLRPPSEWDTHGPWKEGVDLAELQRWVDLFRTIREEPLLYDVLGITPVPGHAEAIQALEEENQQRAVRAEKRKSNREKKQKGVDAPEEQAEQASLDLTGDQARAEDAGQGVPQRTQAAEEPKQSEGPSGTIITASCARDEADASAQLISVKQSKQAVLREILGSASNEVGQGASGPNGNMVVRSDPEDTNALIESILQVPFGNVIASIGKHNLLGDLLDRLGRAQAERRALERLELAILGGKADLVAATPREQQSSEPRKPADDADSGRTEAPSGKTEKQREADRAHKKRQRQRKQRNKASKVEAGETPSPEPTDAATSSSTAPSDDASPSLTQAAAEHREGTLDDSDFDAEAFKAEFPDLLAKLGVLDITVRNADTTPSLTLPDADNQGTAILEAIVEQEETEDDEDSEDNEVTLRSSTHRASDSDSPFSYAESVDHFTPQQATSPAGFTWRGELFRDQDTALPSGTSSA